MAAGIELGTPERYHQNGIEPLGMTAENGVPGGSFCAVCRDGRERV